MKRFILFFIPFLFLTLLTIGIILFCPKKLTSTITWKLHNDGTLVISGQGAMPDFEYKEKKSDNGAPWNRKTELIKSIIIEEGITRIGSYSFGYGGYECNNLTNITFPSTLNEIGESAFSFSCRYSNLNYLEIPEGVTTIGKYGFYGLLHHYYGTLSIPNSVVKIGAGAFYGKSSFEREFFEGEIINLPPIITEENCEECGISVEAYKRYLTKTSKNDIKSHSHESSNSSSSYSPQYGYRDVWVDCITCHGSGKCRACDGKGWYITTRADGSYNDMVNCNICYGSGNCTFCYGQKGHYEKQHYQIR